MKTREFFARAIPTVLFAAGAALAVTLYAEHRNLPINALRAQTAIVFEYPVPPGKIVDAIASAYGVYVNLEYPCDPGGETALLPEMKPSAEVGDSLKTFFESIEKESNGLLVGREIGGALCIVPKNRNWSEHRSNLDRVISVDIEDVGAADALRAVAGAVNQYSVPGYPLKLNPGGVRAGFVPPEVFRTATIEPLHARNISAREAICLVLAHAPFPTSWVYGHVDGAAYLTINFLEDGVIVRHKAASPDEQAYWSNYAEVEAQP